VTPARTRQYQRCEHGFLVSERLCPTCFSGAADVSTDLHCSRCGQPGHSVRVCDFPEQEQEGKSPLRQLVCSGCKRSKAESAFYLSRSSSTGRQSRCKACDRKRAAAYMKAKA
jgi:hypothetical protein